MKVCINLNPFIFQPTGIGIYSYEIFKHLLKLNEKNLSLIGITSSWKYHLKGARVNLEGARVIDLRIPSRLFSFFMHRINFPPIELLALKKIDIVHSPYHFTMPSVKSKKIITVHDIYFLRHKTEAILGDIEIDRKVFKNSLRIADLIIFVSKFTKEKVLQIFPEVENKGVVIYSGIPCSCKQEIDFEEIIKFKKRFNLPENYILYLGTIEERKNLKPLIESIKMINEKHIDIELILAGKVGYKGEEILTSIKGLSFIKYCKYISEEDKGKLYKGARIFVFPSLEEGFGFPLLEAMNYGVPVIATKGSSLEEIGGEAAHYIENASAEEITEAIYRLLEDEEYRRNLIQKGYQRIKEFNWETTAKAIYNAYSQL